MHIQPKPSEVFKLGVHGWLYSKDDESYCIHFSASSLNNVIEIINNILVKLEYKDYSIIYHDTDKVNKIWTELISGSIDFGYVLVDDKKHLYINLENNYMYN
jgi:hypothetical protein